MQSLENIIWNKDVPSEYWYYASILASADNVHMYWCTDNKDQLYYSILCNDNFIGAADSQEISPLDVKYLYDNNYHLKDWREVMQWIADKRGYDKDMIWWIDRKRNT